MNKYEAPRIDVIEFEATDIIQTSGLTNGGSATIPGTGVIVPIPGQNSTTSLDNNY